MPLTATITPVRSERDIRAATRLFEAYAASLPVALDYQDFAAELSALPGHYAPPTGELYLARDGRAAPIGCVGLRPITPHGCCEMKRLFLLPEARGLGLGRALAETVVQSAQRLGYDEVRLDTLPTMAGAIAMYERMGFQLIDPYYAPTPSGTVFLALKLGATTAAPRSG